MLTGEIRNQIDQIWIAFWSGGVSNPLSVIEQITYLLFINLIVDHLTERGAMDPRRLYESPFTDLDDQGVSGLFPQVDVHRIVQVLHEVRDRAAA